MYTIQKYIENTVLLASSLIIKHHDIGVIMNKGLLAQHGITTTSDYRTWKYYLNLNGVKHQTNSDVKITLVESGQIVSLSKDILTQYPATRKELDSRTDAYKALLVDYPNDHIYINGCINPIDIDVAINAEDGTILGYSDQYVEPQEFSLIRELSSSIKLFFNRWYIKEYNITDELYMASTLSMLYSMLPNMIANIRLKDANTSEANSFHVEHYFRSHLDLWNNVRHLKKSTIWWLYRNLPTLMNDVGRNETLNTIIDKIFTDNGIGLANYILAKEPHKINNTNDIMVPRFEQGQTRFNVKELNQHYTATKPTLTTAEVVKQEVSASPTNIYDPAVALDTLTRYSESKVNESSKQLQPTKIIDFSDVSIFKAYNNSLLETIIDTWLVLSDTNKFTLRKRFIDPNTKVTYDLNPKEAIILFYYLLFVELGDPDPVVSDISYRHQIKPNISLLDLTKGLLHATGTDYVANLMLNSLPVPSGIIRTITDFQNLITPQIDLFTKVWSVDSNVNNPFLNANIKKMASRLYSRGKINISLTNQPERLSTVLTNLGISVTITPTYDIKATLTSLFKEFTGFDLKEEAVLAEMYNDYKILLDKLTSYTIQTIPPNISPGDMKAPYSSIAVNNTAKGYIQVTGGKIVKALEDMLGVATGAANNFRDAMSVGGVKTPGVSAMEFASNISLTGYGDMPKNVSVITTKSKVYAEILHSTYLLYTPNATTLANNTLNKEIYTARYGGQPLPNNIFPVSNDVFAQGANNSVTTNPVSSAELLGPDHTLFGPNNSGTANNQNPNEAPATINAGNGANVSSQPGTNDVYVQAANNMVTPQVSATAEVVAASYTPYSPGTSGTQANNLNANAGPSINTTGSNPTTTAQPTNNTVYVQATNNVVTAQVNATAEIIGSNTTKP